MKKKIGNTLTLYPTPLVVVVVNTVKMNLEK